MESEERIKVFNTIEDLVAKFLYYDRKDFDDLPVGRIEELVKSGEISVIEIVAKFKSELEKVL